MIPSPPPIAWVADHDTIAWTLDAFAEEAPVDPTARAEFPELVTSMGEGSTDYGYPDDEGNITIGRGNKIDNIAEWMALEWVNSPSPSQIQAAWYALQDAAARVRAKGIDHWPGGGAFAGITSIRATKACIDALIQRRLDEFDAALRVEWPGWDDAPPPAQSVLMRLAWACGTVGPKGANRHGWPRLWAYWCAKDWRGCADECSIPALDKTEPGANERARNLFLSCVADTEPAPPTS